MARTSGIAELLNKYQATQRSTIENMGKQRQEPSESDGRMAVQRAAPEPRTMQQQMEDVARDREAAKRLGIDRFRTPKRQCSNPECEDPTARPEVDADGNMLCPACGHVDAGAAPELAGPDGSNLSDREGGEGRTFKDDLDNGGADKRRGQEYQDEANVAYYVIDAREVPGATEKQRWWSNNRMNQAMIWADLLREDHEDPNGFAMPPDEVKEIKNILRRVCVTVAQRAPDDELTKEDPDEGADADAGSALKLGSPVLWTILLALEMIARRPEGFKVRRPEFQAIATLEGMHAYLGRFQSRATRRYVEKLNFYTRAKGVEARMAQSSLDRVKTRSAAYVGLGAHPLRQAKIATLDHLLKKSGAFGVDARGQPIGLALAVLNNETPGVMDALPNEVANPRANAREPGVYNPALVNRTKEKEKKVSYYKQKPKEYVDRSLIRPDRKATKPWEFGGGEWSPDKEPKSTRPGDSSSDDDDDDPNLPRELRNLPKALRRSILQEEGRQMVQQPTPQPSSNNTKEWVGFDDAAPANDAGPSSSSDPGGASGAPAPGPAAPPGQPSRASTFSITDLPDDDDDDDDDVDVVVQDMSFGLGDGPSSAPGPDACAPRSGVGPMCVDGQPAEGVVTDEDGAVTALPGMGGDGDDGEDGGEIAQRAIANGNLHLTLEELLAQQRRDLAIMLEEEREAAREKAAQATFEAERKAAEAAAAQEAKEAHYKQEGQYDRSKDPRNDLDEGMKTATPSYQQLLLQGRKRRIEYKGKKVIRALSYEEVRASENFHRRGIAFVREWHAAQAEWHAENLAKLARVKDAEAKKEASRRAREEQMAKARRKREANRQRIMDNKHTRDMVRLEKAIAKNDRAIYDRKGKEYVNPETGEAKTAPLAGFSREKEAQAMAQSAAKKRKQPDAPGQIKQCETCRAFRKVPSDAPKRFSCPDYGHTCKAVWQCGKCGYADKREGAPPEGWSCPDSGRKCLPMPKKGFPKPPPQ